MTCIPRQPSVEGIGLFILACLCGLFFLGAPGTSDMGIWGSWIYMVDVHGFVQGYVNISDVQPPLNSVLLGIVHLFSRAFGIAPLFGVKVSLLLFLWITGGLFVYFFHSWIAGAAIQFAVMLNIGMGYLDIYYTPFLFLSVMALHNGRVRWFAFCYSIAAMIKAQPMILGPFLLIYALQQLVLRQNGKLSWRLCLQHLGLPIAVVMVPLLVIYGEPMYSAISYAVHGHYVNGQAFNLGLLLTYAANVGAPNGIGSPGLTEGGLISLIPSVRMLTLPLQLLFFGAYGSVIWRYWQRRDQGFDCFLKHTALAFLCYYCLNSGVHENHMFIFNLFLTMLAIRVAEYRLYFIVFSILSSLNLVLFFGISGLPLGFHRGLGGVDMAIPFSAITLVFSVLFFVKIYRNTSINNKLSELEVES